MYLKEFSTFSHHMSTSTRWLLIIASPIILPLGYALGAYVILSLIGYHPNAIGWQLAEELAQTNGDPRECLQIIHPLPHFLSPSGGEQRANCIYEYAKLIKDPSACELLMPSRYGLSCVGAAMNFERPCALGNDRSVSGNGIDATLEECVSGPANIRNNACCIAAKARFITSFNDCSSISGSQDILDECHYNVAFKNHETLSCASIIHENLRAACEVQTKALAKDPSICSGCVLPIDNINNLK